MVGKNYRESYFEIWTQIMEKTMVTDPSIQNNVR